MPPIHAGSAGLAAPPPATAASRAPLKGADIRRIGPDDRAALEVHLLRLAGHDRRMRFCGDLGDEAVRRHCALIDWARTEILGCEIDGALRGAVELAVHSHGSEADLAMSIEPAFQGRGLGVLLMRKALTLARNRYLRSIHMVCMVGNRRMQKLAAKFGGVLILAEGEVEGRIVTPWPTCLTLAEEAAMESRACMRAVFRLWPAAADLADAAASPAGAP